MADREEKIDRFVQLTGVDRDRAKFYLESADWNFEISVASFYDNDGGPEEEAVMQDAVSNLPDFASGASAPADTKKAKKPAQSSRFATLGSYQDNDSSSEEEEGQAFYAGGSEHSGQQVLGPKRSKDKGKLVESLFKSAREHGAEEVNKNDQPSKSAQNKFAFKGSGYRLGDTDDAPADVIQGEPVHQPQRQVDMVLKLWKNGFSVDDGAVRDYKDPSNQEFLDSIAKGEVPRELIRLAKGGEVNLNMEDHRTEDFVQPKASLKAFSGEGHMLGSPAPKVVSSSSASGASSSSGSSGVSQSAAQGSVQIDNSKPVTNLQIRLADGTRMVGKFNHSHRIADIRKYIIAARRDYAATSFVLMTTFPNKELTDESLTLEESKLLNAVIVQRMR